MYEDENKGTFLVIDFEIVECILDDFDKMVLLARRNKWHYPNSEVLGEEEMGRLMKRFKGLGKEVVRICIKRGVGGDAYVNYFCHTE